MVDGSFHYIYRYLVTGHRCLGYGKSWEICINVVNLENVSPSFPRQLSSETVEKDTECFAHLSRKCGQRPRRSLARMPAYSNKNQDERPMDSHCDRSIVWLEPRCDTIYGGPVSAHCQTHYPITGQRK